MFSKVNCFNCIKPMGVTLVNKIICFKCAILEYIIYILHCELIKWKK